jgi:hypothetical protein
MQITHQALVEKHSSMQELHQQLAGLQQQLSKYHGLPATVLGARLKVDELKTQLANKETRFRQLADGFD